METTQIIKEFTNYLESDKVLNLKAKNAKKHLITSFSSLMEFNPDLANQLLDEPYDTLKAFEHSVKEIRDKEKPEVKVRFTGVESIPSCNIRVRDIRVEHEWKFKSVTGVIRHVSEIYGEVIVRKFECPVCGNIINVLQERFFPKKEPTRCSCGRKGKFTEIERISIDSQKIVIEEELETIEGTQQPNRLDVILQYGLCSSEIEKFNTLGSRVCVTGILMARPKMIHGKPTNELERYMDSNYIKSLEEKYKEIQITEKDKELIKQMSLDSGLMDMFVQSLAPSIAGYEDVKKAIVLQLFGGVNSPQKRGYFHILLIGDPGTGKTKLAKSVEPTALKYRYTSGARSSKAGLTVMVSKDDFINAWGVEAGAVVLANKGICVADEFDKMSDGDRDALHECMEDQTITLDKANIHTVLQAQTSILACANWKGSRFNPNEEIFPQIDMPDSLISRFDLFYIFIDTPEEKKDLDIINHMLGNIPDEKKIGLIDYEIWKKYVIYAKEFNPKLTKEAKEKIAKNFVEIRKKSKQSKDNNPQVISITARQGDAIRRLSEASARMYLRDVTIEDVDLATKLVMDSLQAVAFDSESGVTDVDRIETGVSSKQQHIMHQIRSEFDRLAKEFNDMVPVDVLQKKFEDRIHEFENVLERLKRSGYYFEPKNGFLRKL